MGKIKNEIRELLLNEGVYMNTDIIVEKILKIVKNKPIVNYKKTDNTKCVSLFDYKKEFGETKRWEVFMDLKENGDTTRQELAERMGWKVSTICARVNELIRDGLVKVTGKTVDSYTSKTVEMIGLIVDKEDEVDEEIDPLFVRI